PDTGADSGSNISTDARRWGRTAHESSRREYRGCAPAGAERDHSRKDRGWSGVHAAGDRGHIALIGTPPPSTAVLGGPTRTRRSFARRRYSRNGHRGAEVERSR